MVNVSSSQKPRVWASFRFSRSFSIRFAISGIFALSFLWLFFGGFSNAFSSLPRFVLGDEVPLENPLNLQSIPLKHKNIVVASAFGWHYDVYMAVAWTLRRIMVNGQGNLQVYAPTPFPFKFQEVVDQYGLYEGEVKDYKDLIGDIKSDGNDGGIDLVILGTCEIDMPQWHGELLAAWDARDAAHKFQVVCVVHNAPDVRWQSTIPEWSRRNAIRLLPISEHVARRFRKIFQTTARSSDIRLSSAGYEHIRVDVHMPILDIQSSSVLSPNRVLSNVVIQGSFATDRRDYAGIFSQLNASLHVEPELWGYSRLQVGEDSKFIPLSNTTLNHSAPFQVHLVGNGWMDIPPELSNIVIIHSGLAYTEYYALLGGMDVCLPAFPRDSDAYYVHQASSTVLMCMENNVPILGIREMREAYTDIDNDKVMITRPAAMSEVQAVRALRAGDASTFLASDPANLGIKLGDHQGIREAVEEMMRKGWIKTKEGFEDCKRKTWERNEIVMMRILRDL